MRLPAAWRAVAFAAAVVLAVNLFVLGAQPIAVGLIPSPWDKLAHAALFAALGALLMIASAGRWGALAVAVLVAIALADEFLQANLPGRVVSVADLAADAVGAAAGVAAMGLVLARRLSP
jgi:VanZ family protein